MVASESDILWAFGPFAVIEPAVHLWSTLDCFSHGKSNQASLAFEFRKPRKIERFVTLALRHHALSGLGSIGLPRRVSAIEKSTGKSSMLTITNEKGSLSKEQIDEMIQARLQFPVLFAWIHVVSQGVCAFDASFRKRLPEYEKYKISEAGHSESHGWLVVLHLMRMWLCEYICCAQHYVSPDSPMSMLNLAFVQIRCKTWHFISTMFLMRMRCFHTYPATPSFYLFNTTCGILHWRVLNRARAKRIMPMGRFRP